MANRCCRKQKWKYVSDASQAQGGEFTYGVCESCGADLIHIYHAIGNASYIKVVSDEFVNEMQQREGKALKAFMGEWFDTI